MAHDDADKPDKFMAMGTYSIVDARKLLAALEKHGVEHTVEFRDGAADIPPVLSIAGGTFGQAAQATICVAPSQKGLAERVHTELFGDCLPNYDASFFSNPGSIPEDDEQA